MGGAFAAVSDDATGAYYNPGAMVFGAEDSMISISNSTNFQESKFSDGLSGDMEHDLYGWRYLVSYAGYFKRSGDFVFGFSYAIDNSADERQAQNFDGGYLVSRLGQDYYYKYGPSISYKASESVGLGLTVYFDQREYDKKVTYLQPYQSADNTGTLHETNQWGSEFGLLVKAGALLDLDAVALALVVSNTSETHREHHRVTTVKTAESANLTSSSVVSNEVMQTPLKTTAGLAWFASPYLLVSADVDYFSLDTATKESVLNVSSGIEYYLTPKFIIRGGLFSNNDSRHHRTGKNQHARCCHRLRPQQRRDHHQRRCNLQSRQRPRPSKPLFRR